MKTLDKLEKADLIRIIKNLISISDDNKLFVDTYLSSLSGNKKVNIDLYKKKISKALDYDLLGGFEWDFEKVDRILNSLANATEKSAMVAEVSVFAVVEGEKITNEMGDIDEAYYESMEDLFEKAAQCVLIAEKEGNDITPLKEKLHQVVIESQDIGWGYGDNIDSLWKEFLENTKTGKGNLRS